MPKQGVSFADRKPKECPEINPFGALAPTVRSRDRAVSKAPHIYVNCVTRVTRIGPENMRRCMPGSSGRPGARRENLVEAGALGSRVLVPTDEAPTPARPDLCARRCRVDGGLGSQQGPFRAAAS